MVLLHTRNRVDMMECLEDLLNMVMVCNWYRAFNLVIQLYFQVKIYCISHDIPHKEIIERVEEMRNAIEFGTWDEPKQKKFYTAFAGFIQGFSIEGKTIGKDDTNLMRAIGNLIDQTQQDFADLCTYGTPMHASIVRDDILEFQRFSKDIVDLNDKSIYEAYMLAVQDGMRCASRIPTLQFRQDDNDNSKWTIRTDFIQTLSNEFAQFFSMMENVRLRLELPRVSREGRIAMQDQKVDKSLEDEKIKRKVGFAWDRLVRDEWKLSTIAQHLNWTREELAQHMGVPLDQVLNE